MEFVGWILLIVILSCQKNDYKNENWPDGSLKKIVEKKEVWTYGKTKLISTVYKIKFFKEGVKDSSAYYKIEGYYDNGQISSIDFFHNGLMNGKSESWYKDGQKAGEMNYKDGILHGRYVTWLPNGDSLEQFVYNMGTVIN